ncbi:MAG TPA: hypothetical protein DD628_03105 [Clostridiales bacterium]|nr:hypothetical protein [Candidatus Apopatosoma intestinale]
MPYKDSVLGNKNKLFCTVPGCRRKPNIYAQKRIKMYDNIIAKKIRFGKSFLKQIFKNLFVKSAQKNLEKIVCAENHF